MVMDNKLFYAIDNAVAYILGDCKIFPKSIKRRKTIL